MESNISQLIFASGCKILGLSGPIRIEVHCLVKASTPHTLDSDVLNQRRGMIENGIPEQSGQTGDFDILHAVHFFPVPKEVLHRGPGDEKCLAAKYGMWLDDAGIIPQIARQLSNPGVVQTGQRYRFIFNGSPIVQVVAEMAVKIQIVLQK